MQARTLVRIGALGGLVAATLLTPAVPPAFAGGGGHGGGAVFHPIGAGFHGGAGGIRGPAGGGVRFGGRGMPPVSGVIHERPGMRPYMTGYGHTDTALRFGGVGFGGYGHTTTAAGGFGRVWGGSAGAYGHTATGPRLGGQGWRADGYGRVPTVMQHPLVDRFGLYGRRAGRSLALRERFRFGGDRRGVGYGGYGGGYEGYGRDADAGSDGAAAYGTGATYGIDGSAGPYGNGGVYPGGYASETPLAARFAEPPLAPGPGASYSPGDRYAYAASEDVGPGPRIITVNPGDRCGCGPRVHAEPVVYRYGVGTAY